MWVFARSGATWAFQARLVRSGAESGGPPAVALSADGNTALLGDPEYREGGLSGLGAAWGCSPARATRGRSREGGSLTRKHSNIPVRTSTVGSAQAWRFRLTGKLPLIGGDRETGSGAWVFTRSGEHGPSRVARSPGAGRERISAPKLLCRGTAIRRWSANRTGVAAALLGCSRALA